MQVNLITRLLGMAITVFILVLTVKSELLAYKVVAWQLALSIPFLFMALLTNTKITDVQSFREHKTFCLYMNSVAIALLFNSVGLLVTRYVASLVGFAYFVFFIMGYTYFMIKDWKYNKIHNEVLIIALMVLLGLIPAFFLLS